MRTGSTLRRNFPTLRLLAWPFRWFFRSRRRVLTAAAVLLAMVVALPLWWSIQLLGLPDIGEPFDVAAFRATTIPDDRNAFVLYRQAAGRFKELDVSRKSINEQIDRDARWSKAGPTVHRWVEENREAMELFRRAADLPDAFNAAVIRDPLSFERISSFFSFKELAFLEASRLEDAGDMEGAWVWYRAALRAAYHVGLRGTIYERQVSQGMKREVRGRAESWAADPRTTPALIRRALEDAIACEALLPSESFTIKVSYLWAKDDPHGRHNPARRALLQRLRRVYLGTTELLLDQDLVGTLVDAWRFWRREPERSRRVLRLAIANWLACEDRPAGHRPSPDPNVSGPLDFYAFGPEAPPAARALSPAALDRWLSSTADAHELLRYWNFRALRRGERSDHRALVVLLGSHLYRRDHGTVPPTDEVLVGPYLEELPDDGEADAPGNNRGGDRTR